MPYYACTCGRTLTTYMQREKLVITLTVLESIANDRLAFFFLQLDTRARICGVANQIVYRKYVNVFDGCLTLNRE